VQHLVPEARPQASLAHDVDPAVEEFFHIGGKSPEVKQAASWFWLDQKVDIAGLRSLAPRDGPEDANRLHAAALGNAQYFSAATPQGFERPTHSIVPIVISLFALFILPVRLRGRQMS
jgi:hypothetical protein